MPGHEHFSAFFLAVNIASLISRFKIFKKQIIYIKNPHHIGEDATLNLLDSVPTTITYLQYNHREKAVPLLHGHIARLPCAGLRLLQKKFRAAAVQMDKLACTAAQTLPGLTCMSKKAISRIANAGGDCGSALARSNLLLFTVWRVGATGD